MSRPPDPSDPPAPAPPAVSFARLMFGPDPPPPSAFELARVRVAVHHAVVLAAAAPEPEVEAFLVALYHRAEATQPPETRRVTRDGVRDRRRAIKACLPPGITLTAVLSVVRTLDPEGLRLLGSLLAWLGAQIGRRMRAMHTAQRQLARYLSPPQRMVVSKAVAGDLADLRRTRALYRSTHRLISRLASSKRPAGLTAEARHLFERFTRAGLSAWRAYGLVGAVLRHWHGLPKSDLTAAHIVARLQKRPKPTSS